MILNLTENFIARLDPMIVDIVECLVEAFHGDPFDCQSTEDHGGFEDFANIDLKQLKNFNFVNRQNSTRTHMQKCIRHERPINLHLHMRKSAVGDDLIKSRSSSEIRRKWKSSFT